MKKSYYEINNNLNLPVKFDLRFNENDISKPLNIILHGFKAYRNWGFIPFYSEKLAKTIGPTINLDFSLNGISDEDNMLYDVDLFRQNTVSQQLKDVEYLIEFAVDLFNNRLNNIWNGEINLIGHSLGGACALISANENNKISRIILLNSISKTDRNTQRQKDEWRKQGYINFKESHSGQELFLDVEYLEDKERNKNRFDLRKIISEIKMPICIIHGKLDFTVKLNEAEILLKNAVSSSYVDYLFIEKCNHTFGVSNKFTESNFMLDSAINKSIEFLSK